MVCSFEFMSQIMKKKLKLFLKNECGATAIEYGLIAAGVAVAIVAAVTQLSDTKTQMFVKLSDDIKTGVSN